MILSSLAIPEPKKMLNWRFLLQSSSWITTKRNSKVYKKIKIKDNGFEIKSNRQNHNFKNIPLKIVFGAKLF